MDTKHIVFGNTRLMGINKTGVLKPNDHGYYSMALGALGVSNSKGEVYVDTQAARKTFEGNGSLMRRLSRGALKGEYGHPKAEEYPSRVVFDRRVRAIDERMVSHHIAKVWLATVEYQGKKVLGIFGEVKPAGPYGYVLGESIENPQENVAFSGRYWSNIKNNSGIIHREIHTVATWDYVSEPGIESAEKYTSPSLESHDEIDFYEDQLIEACEKEKSSGDVASLESSGGLSLEDMLGDFGINPRECKNARNIILNW